LRNIIKLMSFVLAAEDGEIGLVEDFLVEEQAWSLRYPVVDTRSWLPGRKVG
jgi:hypothetical protein